MVTQWPVVYDLSGQASPFHIYFPWVNVYLAECLNTLNTKLIIFSFKDIYK